MEGSNLPLDTPATAPLSAIRTHVVMRMYLSTEPSTNVKSTSAYTLSLPLYGVYVDAGETE